MGEFVADRLRAAATRSGASSNANCYNGARAGSNTNHAPCCANRNQRAAHGYHRRADCYARATDRHNRATNRNSNTAYAYTRSIRRLQPVHD